MAYASLEQCLLDLEKHQQLVRISQEVDPYLEMASIHLRMYEAQGPAILFENVKGSKFRAASNIYGTLDRSKFIFRDTLAAVQQIIELKADPIKAIKHPIKNFSKSQKRLQTNDLISIYAKKIYGSNYFFSKYSIMKKMYNLYKPRY